MTAQDKRMPEFDDAVVRAMAKWPNVPQCFGWLALDRRGAWRIQGEAVRHARAIAFLSQHYRADELGRWYVQNGPQRVFVELEYTPWVFRYHPQEGFATHTGIAGNDLQAVLADDEGNLLLVSGIGIGVLDDRDLETCSNLLRFEGVDDLPLAMEWRGANLSIAVIERSRVSLVYGFDPSPRE